MNRKGGRQGHAPPARFVGTIRIPLGSGLVKRLRRSFLLCTICFHLLAPGREVIDSAACAHPASAGPENVQCRSVFIQFVRALVHQPPLPGAGVQHLRDSRHGRIACKTSLPAVPPHCKVAERSRLQSVLRARGQPLHWLTTALQNSRSHFVFDSGCLLGGPLPGRGDPFSHPSGSSAAKQVRAIHSH